MNSKPRKTNTKAGLDSAAPAIKKELVAALSVALVENLVVDVWSDRKFSGIRDSITKYCGTWLSDYDIDSLIIGMVFRRLQAGSAPDEPLELGAHLNANQIAGIADETIAFLRTIPRSYDILFPLPQLRLMDDFLLSGPVSFVSLPESSIPKQQLTLSNMAASGFPLSAANTAPTPKRMYLKIRATGYANSSRTVSAMHDAMAILKRTVQVGVAKGAFERKRPRGGILASALRGQDTQPILEALVYDTTDGDANAQVVKLGLGMSSYLNDITVREWPPSGVMATPASTIEKYLVASLARSIEALTHISATVDSAALRSAFEWAFDAAADDEVIGACIKTCIALEAALGEDSEERGITERMADRVAYLIGTNPESRRQLREYMRAFYKLRSSLVHGKQTAINPQNHATERNGRTILEMVLKKELKAIEEWWERKRGALKVPVSLSTSQS